MSEDASRTMTGLKATPLRDMHLAAGAKMVPFAGYEMPVQYPQGIRREHLHTREHAGLFDVSHMGQASVAGATARQELERILPVDLLQLPCNRSVYSFMANEAGGIIDDLIVTCIADGEYMLVFNAACKDKDIAHIRANLSPSTRFRLQDKALLALQGPAAVDVMAQWLPQARSLLFMSGCPANISGAECYITRSGYTGEDGFEISVPANHAERVASLLLEHPEVAWVGLGARDSLRLEAGLCLYGHDMDEARSPVEAMLMWAVAKSRRRDGDRAGGFIGAEAIFAQQSAGAREKRVGLRVNGKTPVREGAVIVDASGGPAGHVTSGGFAPSLGAPVAMGYVRADLAAERTEVAAIVRDKPVSMTISKTPFIEQRYFRG